MEFYEPIFKELEPLEISILVNNVGISDVVKLSDQEYQNILDVISVNSFPMGVLTCFLLKKIRNRSKRSGIVNISSFSFVNPLPYLSIYAGTKAFNDAFSQSCSVEDPKNDYLSVRAMKVISGRVK